MSGGWADYWARPGAAGGRGGCLPEAGRALGGALEALWRDFARTLPRKSRVLDLATGGGAVLRILAAERRDLVLAGVDSAPKLPPPPAGAKLRPGVRMEALPFAEAAFDAVTGQFGIEYGDVASAAAEAARVLRPGGRLRAAIHHQGGTVFDHNMARRAALRWAVEESGLLDKARKVGAARARAALPTPRSFREAIERARRLHPGQSGAAEIAMAVAHTLDVGAGRPPQETLEVLTTLEARARGEIERLDGLAAAARDADGIAAIAEHLRRAGFAVEPPRVLAEEGGGPPLAWVLDARI